MVCFIEISPSFCSNYEFEFGAMLVCNHPPGTVSREQRDVRWERLEGIIKDGGCDNVSDTRQV